MNGILLRNAVGCLFIKKIPWNRPWKFLLGNQSVSCRVGFLEESFQFLSNEVGWQNPWSIVVLISGRPMMYSVAKVIAVSSELVQEVHEERARGDVDQDPATFGNDFHKHHLRMCDTWHNLLFKPLNLTENLFNYIDTF